MTVKEVKLSCKANDGMVAWLKDYMKNDYDQYKQLANAYDEIKQMQGKGTITDNILEKVLTVVFFTAQSYKKPEDTQIRI